jgi:hypothetical protein
MPILILSRTRPSLRWERISVSNSIATAASLTAAERQQLMALGPLQRAIAQRFSALARLRHVDGPRQCPLMGKDRK